MVENFHQLEARPRASWFATCDPGQPLGSGGGTAHALLAAWRASGHQDFYGWLAETRIILIHAGGQSRRLPAYAAVGKALMPIPVIRGSLGQSPDQALADIQASLCDELFDRAPDSLRVMIISGDALLRPNHWPNFLPSADVVCMGLRTDADTARHFGAFYVSHRTPDRLDFVLQKPPAEQTRQLANTHDCLLDTGMWLLSEAAIKTLLAKCGVDDPNDWTRLHEYDLYSDFGPALGASPTAPDEEVSALKAAVIPVFGQFMHFGTSRQLIESVTRMHDQTHHAAPLGFLTSARRRPSQHTQNTAFDRRSIFEDRAYWLENSFIPPTWTLKGDNVVTGLPFIESTIVLEAGICLDIAPIGEADFCVRPYGIDDAFKGAIAAADTHLLGRPIETWLTSRGLIVDDLGPATDIQSAHLFPVVPLQDLPTWIEWMTGPAPHEDLSDEWRRAKRLSANALLTEANASRIYAQRRELLVRSLTKMQENHRTSVLYSMDLERTAAILHAKAPNAELPQIPADESLVKQMNDRMFRSAFLRLQGSPDWERAESEAFAALRKAILDEMPKPEAPVCGVAHDQIVWGRSPLRFDLAGGWTDTPPYCLLNGGRVLNLAVNLNGQPPVQVFLRRSERKDILLRSIDLGTEQRLSGFAELSGNITEASEFSLAQAALTLAGFGPESGQSSLAEVLDHFGGGVEMSLLAAVPKGSGLGTSSILAATILAALSEFCRLEWTSADVLAKTMALEQILSTGGGWQDQAGGCLPGIKELETRPGLVQTPLCRWLPDRILGPDNANSVALLYYTGITRVAKSVLREIVRGMFLNSGPRLDTLRRIGENVDPAADAIQRNDWEALGKSVRRSWELNQQLDSGTNPPAVQAMLDQVEDYLLGAKLLGAGGGGFLLMIAKDREAAQRIRQTLTANPPSPKARFFDFNISPVGLEVTKS